MEKFIITLSILKALHIVDYTSKAVQACWFKSHKKYDLHEEFKFVVSLHKNEQVHYADKSNCL